MSDHPENFILPRQMIEEIQRCLEFYASDEFYFGPRTGGVLDGCPRGTPLNDSGKKAGETLYKLVQMYPLPRESAAQAERIRELEGQLKAMIANFRMAMLVVDDESRRLGLDLIRDAEKALG